MKKRYALSSGLLAAITGIVFVSTGCGGKVQGNTYADNGGVVKVEFKSDGKAYVSTGPVSNNCSYSESGKNVTLVCEGDKTIFTQPRGAVVRTHISHLAHHRGQLTVYLRLLDVPVPSIYGPTADERMPGF